MMSIPPNNPLIEETARNIFFMDDHFTIAGSEYDNCKYELRIQPKEQKFYFSWACKYFDEVYEIDGPKMIEKYYPEYTIEDEPTEGYDFTISYSLELMPKIGKKKSDLSTEEKKAQKELFKK